MPGEQVKGFMALIESLWGNFDEVMDGLKTPDDWALKHGADWTMADVPYHMMYTDRDLIAEAIRRGKDVPAQEQRVQKTTRELNEWNEAQFAKRPTGQTGEQSLQQWRYGRAAVRQQIGTLPDEDLMNKLVWFPLVGCGWVPAYVSVAFGIAHTWSEFIQARHIMGRSGPEPLPEATHFTLNFLGGMFPAFMNPEAAKGVSFATVLEFTGPGGGDWTVKAEDGKASVEAGRTAKPDLVITQTPVAFELIRQNKLDPMQAMQSGDFKAEPIEAMQTFGTLFEPDIDQPIPPMGAGAMG
jgi:hypothetical protein